MQTTSSFYSRFIAQPIAVGFICVLIGMGFSACIVYSQNYQIYLELLNKGYQGMLLGGSELDFYELGYKTPFRFSPYIANFL